MRIETLPTESRSSPIVARKHEALALRVEEVERADLDLHPLGDRGDDFIEGLAQVGGGLATDRGDVFDQSELVAIGTHELIFILYWKVASEVYRMRVALKQPMGSTLTIRGHGVKQGASREAHSILPSMDYAEFIAFDGKLGAGAETMRFTSDSSSIAALRRITGDSARHAPRTIENSS